MQNLRPWLLAGIYGLIAGVITAVTLYIMKALEHALWGDTTSRLYIFTMIMVGGVILASIRYLSSVLGVVNDPQLNDQFQLTAVDDKIVTKKRSLLLLACSAIVAVGFGGAIGPEAGLLAVVGEASMLIGLLLAKDQQEALKITQIGDITSLSAFYVAPPASVLLTSDETNLQETSLQPPSTKSIAAQVTTNQTTTQEASCQATDAHATSCSDGYHTKATSHQVISQLESEAPTASLQANNFPFAQKILASVAGLAGFILIGQWLLPARAGKLPLPASDFAFNSLVVVSSYELFLAIVPALLGAAVGVLYVKLLPLFRKLLANMGSPVLQILLGSLLFAVLASLFPLLRFSGHEELYHALEYGIHGNVVELLLLGVLKVVALSLCLASGWKGVAIFPLIFAGASVGAASALLIPIIPLNIAIIAGLSAASMIGLGKPIAVFLLIAFLTGLQLPLALSMGILVSYLVMQWLQLKPVH